MVFNPLDHIEISTSADEQPLESTSALINDTMGICPKCKKPFGSATANGDTVYYCEPCRVTQPIPVQGK